MAGYETAIVRLYSWTTGRPTAGLGLLVGNTYVVTCAHVVNTALGRPQREQVVPGESELVQLEFPHLERAHVRLAKVVPSAWVPPPRSGMGGDIAGLVLTEDAPVDAARARFATVRRPGTHLRVFGYPGSPIRQDGVWVDVDLKGEVGGGLIQVESREDQTVKAQPGFSGSPVWDHGTGQAVGLLQITPFVGEPERDAYLIKPTAVAQAWEDRFDYLLVPTNPYRGLEPFTTKDAELFFGRDVDIQALTKRVDAQPVVIVVGPSGVGKSSLVQAGLIPELQRHRRWSVALVRPGQDPWPRLAAGLLRALYGQSFLVTREKSRRESDRLRTEGFGPTARFLRSEDRPLVVVVDQFEELLATGEHPDKDLLDLLLPAPDAVSDECRLVLTLRADFLPALQSIPGIHARLNERLFLLSPLTMQQMREAMVRPAAVRGVDFEPGLVEQILSDATEGALPVLEFTLGKLWETQRQKNLSFASYYKMGGVRGALDRFSEEKAAQLTDAAAEVLDRVLLRLVHTPGGSPGLAVRQRVYQSEVSGAEWEVVQRLAEERLVILDTGPADHEPHAELAHESLITAWRRLRRLVTENAEFLTWLARVQQRAADGDPLPEARIAESRNWLAAKSRDVPEMVRTFIENSETAAETRLRELRDARDNAEALRLAADAELALRTAQPATTVSLALAVESVLVHPTAQGDLALRNVLRLHPRTLSRLDHDGAVNAVAFSPDGTRVATGSGGPVGYRSGRVFDAATGAQQARLDHDGAVNAVAFSPDGTRVATGSGGLVGRGSARVFDAATGAQLARLDHDDQVNSIAFSTDGTRIATGSGASLGRRGSARVFDATTGTQQARLDHDGVVNAVAFSPDGSVVATASGDGSARVFDAATGAQQARLDHDSVVWAVAFSPDGTVVATASEDGSARVFDAATGAQRARLDHDGQVNAVAFSPDGTLVATASGDGSTRVFDAATGAQLARVDHDGVVWAVAFSPDSTRVATGSGDPLGRRGSARVFDATTGAQQARLDHDGAANAVAFSPDGTLVATASDDGSARVFDTTSGAQQAGLDHNSMVLAVAFSPDGNRIATGSHDRSARVFDATTGALQARLDHDGVVWTVAFSPDGNRIATGSGGPLGPGSAQVFDATTGTLHARLDHDSAVNAVAFSPDGTRIATGSGGPLGPGSAQVFDATTGTLHARLDHDSAVNAVAFSPDGTLVATASHDGSARVFDATTGAQRTRLDHDSVVWAVAFSPDGTRIATGSGDPLSGRGSTRVFNAATGALEARLDHDDQVNSVAFSPDGSRIVTGSGSPPDPGSARIFDAVTGAQQARLDQDGAVHAVAFSPDGALVATASSDRSAHIFEATPDLLIKHAFDVMTRPLNIAELRRYSLPSDCRHVKEWQHRRQ